MKLNRLFTLALMAVSTLVMSAQGIEFMPEGSLLKDAVTKAKAENKMVFLDCYTSWCGPCKMMATKIFPTQEVGDFMNPKFVSIKIDMEKGEGPSLVEKLQVSAYPTFIIFNADGNEVGRFLGGSDAKGFMERVTKNSVDNGSAALDARYAAGERDEAFLMEYLKTLSNAYKRNQCAEVAEILLNGKAETFASDSTLRMIFMGHISNPFCPAFVYTAKHPQALTAAIGETPVSMKIHSVLDRYPLTLISEENGQVSMDMNRFNAFTALLDECNIRYANHYRFNGLMKYAQRKQDWGAYMDALEGYMADSSLDMDDMSLAKNARPIMENCQDEAIRTRLKTILQARYDDVKSGRRPEQKTAGAMQLSRPASDILDILIRTLNGEDVRPS